MKKSALILALCLSYTFAVSQTQMGSFIVGLGLGGANFSSIEYNDSDQKVNTFGLGLYPEALYFLNDGLAIGGSVGLRFNSQSSHFANYENSYNMLSFSLGPAVQYYFAKSGKGMPFVGGKLEIGASLSDRKSKPENSYDYKSPELDLILRLSGGYEYFISEHLGISGSAGLSYTNNSTKIKYINGNISETGYSEFFLNFVLAFNIHIPAGTKIK